MSSDFSSLKNQSCSHPSPHSTRQLLVAFDRTTAKKKQRQLTLPVVGQIHTLAVRSRPVVGAYLQDAGQRADPLFHVLLTLRGQHEVGDLVHLQLKGVFPETVVLRGGREGARTD